MFLSLKAEFSSTKTSCKNHLLTIIKTCFKTYQRFTEHLPALSLFYLPDGDFPSCSPALIGNDAPIRPASQPARLHTSNLTSTFASLQKQKQQVDLGRVAFVRRGAVKLNTMGKIEWAMWANEQALASGLSEYKKFFSR